MSAKIEIASEQDMIELSQLSQRVGNIALDGGCAAILRDNGIGGFASVQLEWHASGSWIRPDLRGQALTYKLRMALEQHLRNTKVDRYFAIPNTEFERTLFAKYGPVTERIVQIKEL